MEAQHDQLTVNQAARWYARLHAADCTESERMDFVRWRELSEKNARAYAVAERVAVSVSEKLATDPRLRALAHLDDMNNVATEEAGTAAAGATPWRVAAAIMLSVSIGLIAALQLGHSRDESVALSVHSNATKQQQRVVLDDGSVVFLDVGSRINVQMSKAARRVELLTGRAYFEVVHNAERPFFVDIGAMRTVDLGTRFQVARTTNEVSVTLVDGSVAVSGITSQTKLQETLLPGEQLLFHTNTGFEEKRSVDADALTSWSRGRLVFKGTPLSEVLNEVNRYSESKIRIGDESLAAIPIGGNFVAGADSSQVVDALIAVLPLRVVHVGANEIILFQRYETETP